MHSSWVISLAVVAHDRLGIGGEEEGVGGDWVTASSAKLIEGEAAGGGVDVVGGEAACGDDVVGGVEVC